MSSHNSNNEALDSTSNGADRTGTLEEDAAANKRAALAGQWRTPPMPAYPSGYAAAPPPHHGQHSQQQQIPSQHQQQQQIQQQIQTAAGPGPTGPDSTDDLMNLPNPGTLPGSSEDYAKALQEAYRKGAEAAARMAQQQLPTAASCPNFQTGPHVTPAPSIGSSPPPPPGTAYQQHPVHPGPSAIPDPLSSSMPPPPPAHHAPVTTTTTSYVAPPPAQQQPQMVTYVHPPPAQPAGQPHQQHYQQHPGTAPSHTVVHAPAQAHPHGTSMPPQPQLVNSAPSVHHAPPAQAAGPPKPQPGRSMSMPDMSAYAAKAEEEKRQKRLARNRASARLRRLRKKNLVDAYETEVGILEKTLKQLQAHEWGKDDDHKTLLDALGMERGQQAIGPEQRTEIIRDILQQQMEQVELLRQAQVEQECLAMVANMDENGDDELCRELQELLQLTDAQKADLLESSKGLDKEVQALETVAASLQAMQENDWLLNEGVQKITDQFTSILHKNQQSKFLLWTDANAEAIDQLDHVQVQPLQNAPIFTFGIESAPVDDDDNKQ